jgi:hypothetical protein
MVDRAILLGLVAVLGSLAPHGGKAQNTDAYYAREMVGLDRALRDPSIRYRVRGIWMQLAGYSGRMHPVVPSQQFNAGQALPNGVVLLDLSIAGNAYPEVTAFWLAHEYGHQVLGHPQLHVTPIGRYLAAMSGTRQEDDADRWAGRFLRSRGWRIAPVLDFLCSLPSGGAYDTHSTGPTRAQNVAAAFGGVSSPCGGDDEPRSTRTVPIYVRIWQRSTGYSGMFDVSVDGSRPETLRNGNSQQYARFYVTPGSHGFRLSNLWIFDTRNSVVVRDGTCSGAIQVSSSGMMDVSVEVRPSGALDCTIR